MGALALYVIAIVAVNYGFSEVPLIPVGDAMWPPLSLAVGLIFVLRDFAQRRVGHWIWLAMLAGCVLSYIMADPFVALASATAFLISEALDWAGYTFTRKPFHQRVLISSALSAPLDSVVFLAMIGHLSWVGVATMTASKMLGALIVWSMLAGAWCRVGLHSFKGVVCVDGWGIWCGECRICGKRISENPIP